MGLLLYKELQESTPALPVLQIGRVDAICKNRKRAGLDSYGGTEIENGGGIPAAFALGR